jgi:hypothetical protein
VTVLTALLGEEVDVLKCLEWHKVFFFLKPNGVSKTKVGKMNIGYADAITP